MNKLRIGVFGGTFDPIHSSHIHIAESAKEQLRLHEVWFFVDKLPFHKPNAASFKHRCAMVNLAVKSKSGLRLEPTKQMEKEDFYRYAHLRKMQRMYPDVDFVLIAGIDTISKLDDWEDNQLLINDFNFAIAPRGGWNMETVELLIKRLGNLADKFKYQLLDITPTVTSSTRNRQTSTEFEDVDFKVRVYIKKNNLYT